MVTRALSEQRGLPTTVYFMGTGQFFLQHAENYEVFEGIMLKTA